MRTPIGFFLLAAALAACAPSVTSLVDDHVRATGLDYLDCGVSDRTANQCGPEPTPAEACMRDAFASCTPARALIDRRTEEGDPVPQYWFVEPASGGCKLVVFSDSSQDAFKGDYADIEETECQALAQLGDATCGALYPDGCQVVGEW